MFLIKEPRVKNSLISRMGVCLLSACLVSAVACKETPKENPKETTPATPDDKGKDAPNETAKAEAPKETTPEEEIKAPEPIDSAKVEALVKDWVKAQNDGNFDAYKASYADKFYGIKRVGPKTYKYDHDGWVKDRARMFKKKMQVIADDIDIQPSSTTAVVKFTQTWASGSYKDVGPKQLIVVKQGGALKISSEEMLASKIQDGKAQAKALPASQLGLVKTTRDHTALVLDPEVSGDMGKGRATSISRGASSYKAADMGKVGAEHKDLIGKLIVFEGEEGQVCQGKVTSLAVLAEATPHFGNRQHWDDLAGMGEGRKFSDAEVAQDIYELADGQGTALVALTDAKPDDCKLASWGHVDGSKFTRYEIEYAPDKGLVEMAMDAFKTVPGYKEIQKDWKKYDGAKGEWYESDGPGGLQVTAIRGDDKTYMVARAQSGTGCGDFYGQFWAMWEVTDGGFVLMSDPKVPGELNRIEAAADANGDGKVELITTDKVIGPVGPVHRVISNAEIPYFDCPC